MTITSLLLIIACVCFFLAFIKGWATFAGADKLDLVSLGLLFLGLSFLIH